MDFLPFSTALAFTGWGLGIFLQQHRQQTKQLLLAWLTLAIALILFSIASSWVRGIALWLMILPLIGIVNIYIGNQNAKLHKQLTAACGIASLTGLLAYLGVTWL